MSERIFTPPTECVATLKAIEADPLNLNAAALAHVRTCVACAEARVHWLAQEDAPHALAPAGYFDRLPERILRKLPTRRYNPFTSHGLLWAAAAVVIVAAGLSGFMAGRANRTPVVEAKAPAEFRDVMPDTPFQDSEDALSQLDALSPEEAETVLKRLETRVTTKP
jgi:hypothetical protein